MPKSFIILPLYFKDQRKFISKRILVFSIFIFIFIAWNSYKNINRVGEIENILEFEYPFRNNIELKDDYD